MSFTACKILTRAGADLEISEAGFKEGSKLIADSAMLDKRCRDREAGMQESRE